MHTAANGAPRRADDVGQALLKAAEPYCGGRRSGRRGRRCTARVGIERYGPYLSIPPTAVHGRARRRCRCIFKKGFFKSENAQKGVPGRRRGPWGGPAWPHVHGTAGSTDRHPAGRPRKRISGLRDDLLRRTGCNGRKAASSRFYECALAQDTRLYVVDLSHHLSVWPHDL